MDLHDYADVAENYDLYLEHLDESHTNTQYTKDFVRFHLDLAKQYGRQGILDIACGTGAVLLPLLEAGYTADGCDLSAAMVKVTTEKAADKGLYPHIYAANMTSLPQDKRYSMATIARSGFMHLLTPADQRQSLNSIHGILLPGGVLTFNTFAPNANMQVIQMRTSPEDYTARGIHQPPGPAGADLQRRRLRPRHPDHVRQLAV